MIEWLDQFVDTRAKRRHLLYLIALFACILLVLPYLFLGLRLLQLSNYPSVFALLKEPLISQTYVSRIILDTISLASFSFTKAITILLKELRPFEVVTALLAAGGIFFCTWQGLSSTSLAQAVVYIRCIGGILCVLGGLLLCFLFYYTRRQLKSYYLALQIRVEELEEQETGGSL